MPCHIIVGGQSLLEASTFRGKLIPFGAEVRYLPSAPVHKRYSHKFAEKTLRGVFAGYHQRPGGYLSGDLFIIDAQDLTHKSASRIHLRRIPGKQVFAKLTTQ